MTSPADSKAAPKGAAFAAPKGAAFAAAAEALRTAHIDSILRGISDDPADFAVPAAPSAAMRFICPEIMLPPAAPAAPAPAAIAAAGPTVNPRLSQTYAAILFMIAYGTPGASVIVNGTYAHETMRRLFPDITFHPLPTRMDTIRAVAAVKHELKDILYINFAWNAKPQTDSPLAYERKSRKMIEFSEAVHKAIGAKASMFNFRTPTKVPYIVNADGSRRPTDHSNHAPNVEYHWVKQTPRTKHISGITIMPPHASLYEGMAMRIVMGGAHNTEIDNVSYHETVGTHITVARAQGYDARIAAMIEKMYRTKFPRRKFAIAAPKTPPPKPVPCEKKTWRRRAPHD